MDGPLQHLVIERLALAEELDEAAVDLVLAACDGHEELDEALGGGGRARTVDTVQPELEVHPPGAYLASVSVEGFRGVGPAARLSLSPGPGLTLVVGRNGSGKSSFAEGLELLMTGASSRWARRTRIWTEGWQNLHHDGGTVLSAELHVDGEPGLLSLRRSWPAGAALAPGDCLAKRGDGSSTTLDDLGWSVALSRYRPFLSYNELGSMFDELKTMYDALAAILGLEDVDALGASLREARLRRERALKTMREEVKGLAAQLEGVDDDRAAGVVAALGARPPDLDAVELALEGAGEPGDPGAELAALRSLCSLPVPDAETVDAALAAAAEARARVDDLAGTDAGRAASLAALLETALRHDELHRSDDCPVCGTGGVIDERWRATTAVEIGRLSSQARAVEAAHAGLAAARRRVADLLPSRPPGVVATARDLGLDPSRVEDAWEQWEEARSRVDDPEAEAAVRATLAGVATAASGLAAAAEAELDRREDAWRPIAKTLATWLPGARAAVSAAARLDALRAAEQWVRTTAADLQAQRLAPITDAAKANWATLRQESNVSLDGFHLRKSGNTRQAEVDVSVDGSKASAFGVMSQGELHALAVSVFLPRAGLPESPFRFMVIDDPVQSMDPAKVDGLARVLERAARARQVVVFTHDDRLSEAIRRLMVPAEILEVTRRPQSVVEVRTALDPVERYVADARALLKEESLPAEVARRVVPGFCRHALEAACMQTVRRRRLGRGERHVDVEELLGGVTRLNGFLSLALFDDPDRGGDVLGSVNNRWGRSRGDVVLGCNKGVHEELGGDLRDFVSQAAMLARDVAALA